MKLLTWALAALAVLAAPATASFPGRNGDLAVSSPFGGGRHIVEIDVRTGDKDWLTPPPRGRAQLGTFGPRYTPDGRRLLYIRQGYDPTSVPSTPLSLWSVHAEGGDAERHVDRLTWGGPDGGGPSLSPDGTRLVYSRFGGVFTARLDGSDERELRRQRKCTRDDGTVDVSECDLTTDPVWSPDGRWFVVLRTGGAVDARTGGLWLMDARDGRLVRRLTGTGYGVDWSPNSRGIVFANAGGGSVAPGDLWTVRIDGRGLRRLTRGRHTNDVAPAWSPDGKWLAWVRIGFEGDPLEDVEAVLLSVWRRRLAGGRAQQIATLPEPDEDDGFFDAPTLSWQPRPRPRR